MRLPKLAISRVRKFSLARTITSDIISHLSHLNAPRENAETTRNRRSRKAPIKGPRLAAILANYGEIAAKFAM